MPYFFKVCVVINEIEISIISDAIKFITKYVMKEYPLVKRIYVMINVKKDIIILMIVDFKNLFIDFINVSIELNILKIKVSATIKNKRLNEKSNLLLVQKLYKNSPNISEIKK